MLYMLELIILSCFTEDGNVVDVVGGTSRLSASSSSSSGSDTSSDSSSSSSSDSSDSESG